MGLIEDFANLPLHYVLIIVALLKLGLVICLCGTDWCSSEDPIVHKKSATDVL